MELAAAERGVCAGWVARPVKAGGVMRTFGGESDLSPRAAVREPPAATGTVKEPPPAGVLGVKQDAAAGVTAPGATVKEPPAATVKEPPPPPTTVKEVGRTGVTEPPTVAVKEPPGGL